MARDWQQWHGHYDRGDLSLAQRLDAVQHALRKALAELSGSDNVHLTTICSGDGRDVLPVLAQTVGGQRVRATLIELDLVLAERARARADQLGLAGVQVLVADAGTISAYVGVPAADVLTACGVFGNISVADVEATIAALPALLAPSGVVIWTRGVEGGDRTPAIRACFAGHGFTEVSFTVTGDGVFRVGVNRLTVAPAAPPIGEHRHMFTFR